jgi:hypothetical protein
VQTLLEADQYLLDWRLFKDLCVVEIPKLFSRRFYALRLAKFKDMENRGV